MQDAIAAADIEDADNTTATTPIDHTNKGENTNIDSVTNNRKTKLFFKDQTRVQKKLQTQLQHLECLRDPDGVQLHQKVGKKVLCSQGTNKNERKNIILQSSVFQSNFISVQRADQCMRTVLDNRNCTYVIVDNFF